MTGLQGLASAVVLDEGERVCVHPKSRALRRGEYPRRRSAAAIAGAPLRRIRAVAATP